ncbi:MAG TPA: hypothetical protein VFW21_04710 [Mycobacterium sp.]|nr:hypothetical protein [Mycobacterium sp.]
MITTPAIGATFVQAAHLLATHLVDHALPEPASLEVISRTHHSRLTVQVQSMAVPEVASEVLGWVDTLTTVTVQAWRTPTGERVHLSMTSTLSNPAATVELTIFGGAEHDPALVGDLAPGEYRAVTLGELHTWAADASEPPTDGEALTR